MSENLRVKSSQYIDETTRVSFKFNGTTYYGFKGDTLASALLANKSGRIMFCFSGKIPCRPAIPVPLTKLIMKVSTESSS